MELVEHRVHSSSSSSMENETQSNPDKNLLTDILVRYKTMRNAEKMTLKDVTQCLQETQYNFLDRYFKYLKDEFHEGDIRDWYSASNKKTKENCIASIECVQKMELDQFKSSCYTPNESSTFNLKHLFSLPDRRKMDQNIFMYSPVMLFIKNRTESANVDYKTIYEFCSRICQQIFSFFFLLNPTSQRQIVERLGHVGDDTPQKNRKRTSTEMEAITSTAELEQVIKDHLCLEGKLQSQFKKPKTKKQKQQLAHDAIYSVSGIQFIMTEERFQSFTEWANVNTHEWSTNRSNECLSTPVRTFSNPENTNTNALTPRMDTDSQQNLSNLFVNVNNAQPTTNVGQEVNNAQNVGQEVDNANVGQE